MILFYHNKRCSKSRACLELISNSNSKYKVINYLEDDIPATELEALVKGLVDPLEELVRTNEPIVKNKKINFENKEDIINLLIKNKNCMQRPIVGVKGKFEICRPVDKVLKYLEKKTESK
tara:strand:+ start:1223 stop:1582 length:360 start_codon:yes stop_codon:yes gene_type:complete